MSMIRLIISTALGFFVAQVLLYCLRQLRARVRSDRVRVSLRSLAPLPAPALISGFVRYAPPVAVSAALITLGAWAIKDHLAAKRAGSVPVADVLDPTGAAPLADARVVADDVAALNQPSRTSPPATPAATAPDPYADPDFKVPVRSHRAGGAVSLKEALLQRSESKARADLLRDTREQRNRSQYDCEAAVRAEKYLKAGLDVWGFAAWQLKYFPADGYKGATLPECRAIKNVVDPSRLNLQSAVAQGR
jgi:hypothetical protein